MKTFIMLATALFIFTSCSSHKVEPKIEYVYETKYVYLPCKAKVKKSYIKHKTKKSMQLNVKPQYRVPKQTTIFAPKRFRKQKNKKMSFMVGINKDKSEFIYLEGTFEKDTYKNFIKFMDSVETKAKEIKINSNGGLLSVAMELGAYVKRHHWNTGVDKEMQCMSACGFVYFAGKKKFLEDKAVVGLHRPYYSGRKDTQQSIRRVKKDYISYWNYIRAPRSLYDAMMEVDRNNLFILNKNNINDYVDVEIQE